MLRWMMNDENTKKKLIHLSGCPDSCSHPGGIEPFCCCNNTGLAGALSSKAFCNQSKIKSHKLLLYQWIKYDFLQLILIDWTDRCVHDPIIST